MWGRCDHTIFVGGGYVFLCGLNELWNVDCVDCCGNQFLMIYLSMNNNDLYKLLLYDYKFSIFI